MSKPTKADLIADATELNEPMR
ncbi:MAG: hypothetical protein K0Q55_3115, partial [Verrucomicrobia bacterium]|nr:hypothetical protein [Verrucomicrobiota bacterium]